jgi:CRP-like cAMP-binding protein
MSIQTQIPVLTKTRSPKVHPETRPLTKNRILNALSFADYQHLHLNLETVKLTRSQVLFHPDEKIKYVYFPESAMISVIATTPDGQAAEVGVIGREGIVGVDVLMGVDSTANECLVQLSGGALRIKTEIIKKEFKPGGTFHDVSLRYIHALMMQISQTALCNRLHSIEQRLSRWLLMCHDRSTSDVLALTQDSLAVMLGVNRPSLTLIAIALQESGFIKYSRGKITIYDRKGLEDVACDCYQVVKPEYDNLPS